MLKVLQNYNNFVKGTFQMKLNHTAWRIGKKVSNKVSIEILGSERETLSNHVTTFINFNCYSDLSSLNVKLDSHLKTTVHIETRLDVIALFGTLS